MSGMAAERAENPNPVGTKLGSRGCDILGQGLMGLIGYSYQQGIPSFPEAYLKRTPG
jgi:hypothetical protein